MQKAREAETPMPSSHHSICTLPESGSAATTTAARDLYLESLALADRLGNTHMKQVELHNLGWVELHRGDLDSAARMFADRDAHSGADAYGDAWQDLNAAGLALSRGERDDAVRLFESGKRKLDELGVALDPDDQFEMDWLTSQLSPPNG